MQEVRFLKDFSIAFDGLNSVSFSKGDAFYADEYQLERLTHYGVVELISKAEPTEKKVVSPEIKEKPKKKAKKADD